MYNLYNMLAEGFKTYATTSLHAEAEKTWPYH